MYSLATLSNLTNVTGDSDDTDADSPALGILMGAVGSIGVNIGQNIQAYTEFGERYGESTTIGKYHGLIGTLTFVSFSIVNFAAFGFAPVSILGPLEGLQFLSNLAFSLVFPKKEEKDDINHSRRTMIMGTIVVCIGVVMPVLASPGKTLLFAEDELIDMWARTEWVVLASLMLFVSMTCFLIHQWRYRKSLKSREHNKKSLVAQMIFGVHGAVFGAIGVVNAKVISQLIDPLFSNGDWSPLTSWFFWFTLLMIVLFLTRWLVVLQMGPQSIKKDPEPKSKRVKLPFLESFHRLVLCGTDGYGYSAVTSIPITNGSYIILASIAGGVFFGEFSVFDTKEIVLYLLGLFTLAVGLAIIPPVKATHAIVPGCCGVLYALEVVYVYVDTSNPNSKPIEFRIIEYPAVYLTVHGKQPK